MPRYTRIHRLLKILTLIQSGPGYTVSRLASECAVAERTVFRDLTELKGAGIPIRFDERSGAYTIARGFFLPPLSLTTEEATALAVLCERIARNEHIPGTLPAWAAVTKIKASLPAALRAEVDRVVQSVSVRMGRAAPREAFRHVFGAFQQSIATRRALLCRLHSDTDGAEFDFEPYSLVFDGRAWHALGHDSGRHLVVTLPLNRIAHAALTHRPFEIPRDFSPDHHFGNAWSTVRGDRDYDIVLRVEPPFADGLDDSLVHPTQSVERHTDGAATFRCTVSGLDEVLFWVLSMGTRCRVVAPNELRERVFTEASAVIGMYDGRPNGPVK